MIFPGILTGWLVSGVPLLLNIAEWVRWFGQIGERRRVLPALRIRRYPLGIHRPRIPTGGIPGENLGGSTIFLDLKTFEELGGCSGGSVLIGVHSSSFVSGSVLDDLHGSGSNVCLLYTSPSPRDS